MTKDLSREAFDPNKVSITQLEATLECGDKSKVNLPPMPGRRKVSVAEFEADMAKPTPQADVVVKCPDCNGLGWFGSGPGSGYCDGECGGGRAISLKKIIGKVLVDFLAIEREGKLDPRKFVWFEDRIIKAALSALPVTDAAAQIDALRNFVSNLGFDPDNIPADEVEHYEQCECCGNFHRMEQEADALREAADYAQAAIKTFFKGKDQMAFRKRLLEMAEEKLNEALRAQKGGA